MNFLTTKLIGVLKETRLNMSMRPRLNWNLEVLVLRRGKNQSTQKKKLSEQRKEPTTDSTHIRRRAGDLNLGHTGERRVMSPLRHPLLH